MERKYVIMHGPQGDAVLFWRTGGMGYTPNLDEAQTYTKAEAERRCSPDRRDRPCSHDVAEHLSFRAVNHSQLWHETVKEQNQ